MAYIKLWRADTYFHSIEEADVEDLAPVGVWMPPMLGDGQYAYFETRQEAKNALIIALLEEIGSIRESIDKLSKEDE